jgi:hypothetical protein
MEQPKKSWLQLLVKQMAFNTLSIIFIIIVYLMLWIVPQINDLIVVIIQSENHWLVVPIFLSVLSVFAFLISSVNEFIYPEIPDNLKAKMPNEQVQQFQHHQDKLFTPPKDRKEVFIELKNSDDNPITEEDFEETSEEYLKRMFPKVLGTILILVAAFAVNNTAVQVYEENFWNIGHWGLLISIVLLVLLTNKKIADWLLDKLGFILKASLFPIIVIGICLSVIFIFGFMNQGGSIRDVQLFFTSLLLLALFFIIVTTSYNTHILTLKKYAFKVITFLTILIFCCYLYLFILPWGLKFLTPLSIVLICLVGVYSFLNLIRFFSARFKRFPSLPLVLVVLAFLAIITTSRPGFNHYKASETKTSIKLSDRITLEEYTKTWIQDRYQDIASSTAENPFPIIFVSSEGGGSRAGLWTFLVQSYLFDQNPDYFEKYLFSLSGASGGGVGNNLFYTQAYEILENSSATPLKYPKENNEGFYYRASTIYNADYLSSSVASLLGRDSFVSITGLFPRSFEDRGALLENEWENGFSETFNRSAESSLGAAYLAMMPELTELNRRNLNTIDSIIPVESNSYIRPLLITSVTHLQTGKRYIISPVDMKNSKYNMDVFPDLLEEYVKYNGDSTMIKRSTAMSMNARFPYLSPVARIDSVGQFGDAGYYNNIGGGVSLRLQQALMMEMEKYPELKGKYSIRQLSVTNKEKKNFKYSSQLTAPLSMIANATFAHPKESESTFDNRFSIQSAETIIENEDGEKIKPFIPLGRYLSKNSVLSMEQRLLEIETEIQKIIQ